MSQKFCIICCCLEKAGRKGNEAQQSFSRFCAEDLGFSFQNQTTSKNWCLKLPFGEAITVCSDCLSVIVLYIQKKSVKLEQEAKLEELQKAVVKALKELCAVVKDVETQIDQLHKIVRNGDESCLLKIVRKERGDEVRTFREKVLLVSNGRSHPEETFPDYGCNMILPVVSSLATVECKEELDDPIAEDDFNEPYIDIDSPYMDDFTSVTLETVNTSNRAHGPSFSKSKSKRLSTTKAEAKKKKPVTNTDTNSDAYMEQEFEDNAQANVKVDVDYEMTLPLALRRKKRSIQSTTSIKKEDRESECESEEDAFSDAGSNFSDMDVGFQMLKGNQILSDESEESDSNSPCESASSDAERIVCEADIDFEPKPSKRKKKYKTKKVKLGESSMSEFKSRIVNRVLNKLEKKKQVGNPTSNNSDVDGTNSKNNEAGSSVNNLEPFIGDPRQGYAVEYNVATDKLTVHGTEIIVDETERSLKCTLCDFVANEAESKKAVRTRSVEFIMQDHIAGTHFSCFKCPDCDKIYATRQQFTWHRRTHREKRCLCNICGRPFNTQYDLKRHKWRHMSKEEQEEAVRNGMKDFSKPWEELKSKPLGFQCKQCGNQFRTIVQLKSHELRIHTDNRERIMCNNCGKFFLPGPSMMYHELNCLKEDLKEVHECYICQKKCKNKITLGRHIKLHSVGDETPFLCTVCGKGVKSKGALKKHNLVHSDERPFVCGCGVAFKWKKHLVRHQKVSCKSCDTNPIFKEESQ